jgi:hypothetical protein
MYHRIIILALLFFPSQENETPSFFYSPMEISDALPVQFWLTGCATYNEHNAPGVHHKCWCAPWECDDEIKIQFTDEASQNYSLLVYDENEALLDEIDIEEVQTGVYQLSYIPEQASPGVCDERIQLKIQRNAGTQGVTLPALNTWANSGGSGDPWTTGSAPSITGGILSSSETLYADFAFIVGVEYKITVTYTCGSSFVGTLQVIAMDGSFVSQFSSSTSNMGVGAHTETDILVFTATASTTRIGLDMDFGTGGTITINSVTATRSIGSDEIVAKSDCLDIKQNHEDTILITYENHVNFAGLVYVGSSPEPEFYIRVPAIFFHQRFPEEDEVMELSTSLATLNGTLRKQRLLDVDYVPYYFHEKLKFVLKHQTVTIFSRQWVKQEVYEIVEGDRRWPVKKAKCWISEKDFVHRNVL